MIHRIVVQADSHNHKSAKPAKARWLDSLLASAIPSEGIWAGRAASKNVGLIRRVSSDLAGYRPNSLDSEETVDFSARKSSVTKRRRASIPDEYGRFLLLRGNGREFGRALAIV